MHSDSRERDWVFYAKGMVIGEGHILVVLLAKILVRELALANHVEPGWHRPKFELAQKLMAAETWLACIG
ncbi:MAG: hypothetical protein JSU59_10895 [Nitrospirota bacterium]|nr:MAG: hypothetical protein JSU59_10895 [Nitrospirota bacterium]